MIEITWQGKQEAIQMLIERDGDLCFICKNKFGKKEKRTLDHWVPLSKGGTWNISNLRLAHKQCNLWKGDRMPLPDGTVPDPPPRSNFVDRKRVRKRSRPKVCSVCMSGRILLPGERCAVCHSDPQPRAFPGWAKRKSNECDHKIYHCYACVLGFARRAS